MNTKILKNKLAVLSVSLVAAASALAACSSDTTTVQSTAAASAGGSTVASGSSTDVHGFGSRSAKRNVQFISYVDPGPDPFWNQIATGAQDAATVGHLTYTSATAAGDAAKMTSLIRSAIKAKPDALVVSFNDPAWEAATCEASQAGIAVFAFNVPPSNSTRPCIRAFVGQNFTAVGTIIGQRLLSAVAFKAKDKILCPAEEPGQQYAIQRGGGVNIALKSVGLKCTFLRTAGDDATALAAMTAWLKANPDVKAIVPLGGTPHRNAIKAEDAAGVKAPIIGFDISSDVIAGIKSGRIIAAADQQGYVQGFQSVLQAALYLDFGISPSDINSGGNSLIDRSNVANLEATDLKGVRW